MIREQTSNKQGKNTENLGIFSKESTRLEHFIAGTPLEFAAVGLDMEIGRKVIAMIYWNIYSKSTEHILWLALPKLFTTGQTAMNR